MEPNGKDLLGFFDYAADKGLMGKDWAATLKSACKVVLTTVEPDDWETLDLQTMDLDSFIARFERLKMADLKPDSLNVYGKRLRNGMGAYLEFLRSPSTWQYNSGRSGAKRVPRSKRQQEEPAKHGGTLAALPGVDQPEGLIAYPYPLRSGLVLTIALPTDLTQKEVDRLTNFLRSLALDEQRALPPARKEEAS